ncbi:unnamed protein product [Darwinula stevensoni]|uniref:Uncharacterized protein n=1 Tax=Darwinula stevensoni TaxID=69355 RepID=A0A7R8XDD2_9CRUS|nr:unnamed protein product [Darwinula stevensoni]CAG0893119.1 unnamed protein product [Darwinula stevensoni]
MQVIVKPSQRFLDTLKGLREEGISDESLRDAVRMLKKGKIDTIELTYEHLKNCSKLLPDGVSLHTLIEESMVVLPRPYIPPRNPELEKRIQRLRKEQENRQYQEMTKNLTFSRQKPQQDTIGFQMRELNAQIISVAQFIVTVGGAFVFVYKAMEYGLPTPYIPGQVLAGIFAAIIVAVAELYFLMKEIAHSDRAIK